MRPGFDPWVPNIPLKMGAATHSSILDWRIPWTAKPGVLQSMGQSWTWLSNFHFTLFIWFIFSNNLFLVSLIFAIVFFISISYISPLIYMISFPLTNFGFICSSFSSCFRWKVRLFIWDFSCFSRRNCIAINFPLRFAFAVSHRFWVVVFSLSFVSKSF